MCQEIFFMVVATGLSGMPTPGICFIPGQLRWTLLPKERYGDSVSVGESVTQPSNSEVDTTIELYHSPSEVFFANAQMSGDVW